MKLSNESWLLNRPIAHRGLHNDKSIPENSLLAFELAAEKNYPVELDVQILADENVVVFHDYDHFRLTNVKGKISEQTFSSIKKLHLCETAQKIPLIEEVFELVNGKIPILIEVKNEGKIGRLEPQLLKKIRNYKGEIAVQSFNPFTIRWFKENAPEIIRGQLSSDFKESKLNWYERFLLRNLFFIPINSPMFISYNVNCTPNLITNAAQFLGYPLIVWTVMSEEQQLKAAKYAKNIIFEGFIPK